MRNGEIGTANQTNPKEKPTSNTTREIEQRGKKKKKSQMPFESVSWQNATILFNVAKI